MSRETYNFRIAKSPWSNFYFAAVAAAPTAAAAAELWSFAAKNSFQTKAFKGQQIPLALLKKVTESHDALETIKLTIRQSNISV